MKRSIIFLLPIIVLLGSCKKWLDVKPESQVAADQLFTNKEGFEEALNGVYTRCNDKNLYGAELTMGLPDVLALDWLVAPGADYLGYLQTSLYNYKDQSFVTRRDSIWGGLYNAIANDNYLLQKLDSGSGILPSSEYALIRGEALALRAYIHFDLLRLFAPSYVAGAGKAVIPYVTTFSNKVTPASTVADFLKLAARDLNDAKALLKTVDPILSPTYYVGYPGGPNIGDTSSELKNPNLFLQNRRQRLNYYAVCGELARVYLYMNDKTNALANAQEVIQSNKFPWTDFNDFTNVDPQKKDRILYKELVFGWPIPKVDKDLVLYFYFQTNNGLYLSGDMAQRAYETGGVGGSDLRYAQWFTPGTQYLLVKYKRDATANLHPIIAPALRKSELFYIAAECSYASNPTQAFAYMDSVRFNRHIGTHFSATSEDDFLAQLTREARKEFYGEGQIFYMYKRLNRGIVGPTGIVNTPTDANFVLPLPENEIEFGGR